MTMIIGLELRRRDVAQRPHQPVMVEPGDPFQRCQFHRLLGLPWPAPVDDLGLVQPVDGLGQRVVVGVAPAADRGSDAGFGKAFGIAKRQPLQQVNGGFRGRF